MVERQAISDVHFLDHLPTGYIKDKPIAYIYIYILYSPLRHHHHHHICNTQKPKRVVHGLYGHIIPQRGVCNI